MFDFLHEVQRKAERGSSVPVVCCRTQGNPFPLAAKRAIELALEALGVGSFVDLAQLRAQHGETAYAMFRAMVLAHLKRPPS
jgi:hypothetical protein